MPFATKTLVTLVLLAATGVAMLATPSNAWAVGSGGRVMWENDCDFYGSDYRSVGATPDRCGDLCADDWQCSHWTWSNYGSGTCWLKNGGTNTKKSNGGTGCGYVNGRFNPSNPAQQASNNGLTPQENQEMLASINAFRANNGLGPLALDDRLVQTANSHSNDQANRCTMTHQSGDGRSFGDRLDATGYQWGYVAENVAAGQQTVQQAMNSWVNSPGHRANLLSATVHVGFAKAVNNNCGSYKVYWTQDFARPL